MEEPGVRAAGDPPAEWEQDVATIAGSLVHEIKNPLSTLQINIQLLLEDWAAAREPRELRAVKRLKVMQSEVKRLEGILTSFLSFTRRHELHRVHASINEVLDGLIELVREPARRGGVEVRASLGASVPRLALDVGLMRQVFLNLIKNAQEAMPSGGELILKTRHEAPWVIVDVIDTGKGIPAHHFARLFRLYFSTKPQGSGLGLAWSRRIVREHGGDIEVRSVEGKGSQFTVRLPAPGEE